MKINHFVPLVSQATADRNVIDVSDNDDAAADDHQAGTEDTNELRTARTAAHEKMQPSNDGTLPCPFPTTRRLYLFLRYEPSYTRTAVARLPYRLFGFLVYTSLQRRVMSVVFYYGTLMLADVGIA